MEKSIPIDLSGFNDSELAVIGGGGGTKCFAGAGFMCGLFENIGIREPAVFVVGSGMNVAGPGYILQKSRKFTNEIKKSLAVDYFEGVEKENRFFDYLKKVRCFLTERKAIRKSRFWQMIDLDIIMDIFQKQGLLERDNLNEFFASPINYIVPALDAETGDIRYFSNRDEYFLRHKKEFVLNAKRASMNLFFGAGVGPAWDYVDVMGYKCIDSLLTSEPKTHLEMIAKLNEEKNLGIKKILMLDHDFPKGRFLDEAEIVFDGWLNLHGKVKERYCEQKKRSREYFEEIFPKTGIEHYIVELKDLPIGTISNNFKGFCETFDIGYNLTLPVAANNELYNFLGIGKVV